MARTRREIQKLHRKKERRLKEQQRHPGASEQPEGEKVAEKEKPKRTSRSKKA
jgi:hypothetical protein